METPIQVLIREIRDESQNCCELYSHLNNTTNQNAKRVANDNYVKSIRRISELVHAIEKLNQM